MLSLLPRSDTQEVMCHEPIVSHQLMNKMAMSMLDDEVADRLSSMIDREPRVTKQILHDIDWQRRVNLAHSDFLFDVHDHLLERLEEEEEEETTSLTCDSLGSLGSTNCAARSAHDTHSICTFSDDAIQTHINDCVLELLEEDHFFHLCDTDELPSIASVVECVMRTTKQNPGVAWAFMDMLPNVAIDRIEVSKFISAIQGHLRERGIWHK